MRSLLAVALVFLSSVTILAQDAGTLVSLAEERIVRKRILINDIENRNRDIQFAPVRSLVRYEMAAWLWKDGKDEIGRAEELAMAAAEDLLKHRAEIPSIYFSTLFPKVMSLLERYSPHSSKALKEKYDVASIGESGLLNSMLNQKDGEKAAVDEAIRSLSSGDVSENKFLTLLDRLHARRSPEYTRLLNSVLAAGELGRLRLHSYGLTLLSAHFDPDVVGNPALPRFLTIVVNKAELAAQDSRAEIGGFLDLLDRYLQTINSRFPELSPGANTARAILSGRLTQISREERERNERIANSADKIAALISEAERTDDVTLKNDLYMQAARLALREKKFVKAIDIIRTTEGLDLSTSSISKEILDNERNQLLAEIVKVSLDSDHIASANHGIRYMTDPIRKTELLTLKSKYYSDKGSRGEALSDLGEAIKHAENIADLSRRSSSLIKMLPVAKKLDAARVFEINQLAAKAINGISGLELNDTPMTENYQNYVTKIMIINWNLLPTLNDLAKTEMNGASDLVGRIDKKEIKIIGEMAVALSSFKSHSKENIEALVPPPQLF